MEELSLMDVKPHRIRDWENRSDGRVTILVPRYKNNRIGRWLAARIKPSTYRVHLDEFGSRVWSLIDGKTPGGQIAHRLREKFGERVEPVETRLTVFLQKLLKNKFISFGPGHEKVEGSARRKREIKINGP